MNLYKKLKYYLTEMSKDKAEIRNTIDSQMDNVIKHLLKCLLIQGTAVNHWSNEIRGFIPRVYKLKGTNKYPSEKMLYSFTLGIFADALMDWLDGYVEEVSMEENIKIKEYNKQSLYDCIISYYKWLIHILSTTGSTTPSQVKSQINTLIQKYNTETKQRQEVTV